MDRCHETDNSGVNVIVLIGVDDTDVIGSPGTGRVARALAGHIQERGGGTPLGVTRHQLLVHPAIPYTSHNSSLCIALDTAVEVVDLAKVCREFLEASLVVGADPGLCVARQKAVTPGMQRFGEAAKTRVLAVEEAFAVGSGVDIVLCSVAGAPVGVIGALAAVGLRAAGNDGRYVDVPGARDIQGVVSVDWLLRHTAVSAVMDTAGRALAAHEQIDSQDWIRPSLVHGAPVLRVRQDTNGRWIPHEPRNRNPSQDR